MEERDVERLLKLVQEKVLQGEFTFVSGKESSYYFDGRWLLYQPRELI